VCTGTLVHFERRMRKRVPPALAQGGNKRLAVACEGSNALVILDAEAGAHTRSLFSST
jgi:hypothetical protein